MYTLIQKIKQFEVVPLTPQILSRTREDLGLKNMNFLFSAKHRAIFEREKVQFRKYSKLSISKHSERSFGISDKNLMILISYPTEHQIKFVIFVEI